MRRDRRILKLIVMIAVAIAILITVHIDNGTREPPVQQDTSESEEYHDNALEEYQKWKGRQ